MSRVLVTGASGFIGTALRQARRSRRGGALCLAACRNGRTGAGGRPTSPIPTRPQSSSSTSGPTSSITSPRSTSGSRDLDAVLPVLRHNLVLTVNVLVAAVRANCGLVVLAGSLEEPEPGESYPVPSSPYAAAKLGASAYARMLATLHGLRVVDLRIFMVYGPGQRPPKVVPAAVMPFLQGEPPKLSSGLRPVDWVYVDDVAEAFAMARLSAGSRRSDHRHRLG